MGTGGRAESSVRAALALRLSVSRSRERRILGGLHAGGSGNRSDASEPVVVEHDVFRVEECAIIARVGGATAAVQ